MRTNPVHVAAHQQRNWNRQSNRYDSPRARLQGIDDHQGQNSNQHDHDSENGDQRSIPGDFPDFVLCHLAKRLAVTPERRAQNHEILHCSAKRHSDDDPESAGQKSELRRERWSNERTWASDRREVMSKGDPLVGRREIAPVIKTNGGSGPVVVERENLCRDDLAVDAIRDDVRANSSSQQPRGIDGLTARKCQPRETGSAEDREEDQCNGLEQASHSTTDRGQAVKLRIGYVSRNLTMRSIKLTSGRALATAIAVIILIGCGSSAPKPKDSVAPARSALSGMLGRPMLILPAQYLGLVTPGGQFEVSMTNRDLLTLVDDELEDAFRKRGVRSTWTFARAITASAMRNGGLIQDPRELSAETLRRVEPGDTPLPEPLGTQIRQLVALQDGRNVLIPIEMDVDNRPGRASARLKVVLVDSRTARVIWVDTIEAPAPADVPAEDLLSGFGFRRLSRAVATRFADMVVAQ